VDRPSFWKWAIPLVLGLAVLSILPLSGAARSVGGLNAAVIVRLAVVAVALARLVLIVLLAMALARRFRDIGWPAWIGPTTLLVIIIGLPFLVSGYAAATHADILKWAPTVSWISDSLSLVLVIVVGFVPGSPRRSRLLRYSTEMLAEGQFGR
jgi:uncharacterized membrane protein YhaH (DUF805 family)